uniref:Protein kinase domain-containing protein n=1 Tax=Panagrolaimus sp. JU765 TaxID=591449 RepID=A0AC34R8E9_9BILA
MKNVLELGWSRQCDLWAIGCVIYELYTGKLLFNPRDDAYHLALMERIIGDIPFYMINKTKFGFNETWVL